MEVRAQAAVGDATLVERVSRGDVVAFGALYDRYARQVFVVAAHSLGHDDAEEVVQDAFLRLWRKAGQFNPSRGSFAAWFMTIARHCVFDELKRRRSAVAAAEQVDEVLASAPDPAPGPDEEALLTDQRIDVLAAVRRLPDEQRRALVLAYFGGLSQSAIAELLGVPLGTVKKRLRLGLEKLRASLPPPAPVEDREGRTVLRQR